VWRAKSAPKAGLGGQANVPGVADLEGSDDSVNSMAVHLTDAWSATIAQVRPAVARATFAKITGRRRRGESSS